MATKKIKLGKDESEYSADELIYVVRSGSLTVPGSRSKSGTTEFVRRGEPVEAYVAEDGNLDQIIENHRESLLALDRETGVLVDHTVERELSPEEETALMFRNNHASSASAPTAAVEPVEDEVERVPYSWAEIEDADYTRLRSIASEVEGVSGNQGTEQIREALREAKRDADETEASR
ncbi:hypothetical protein SAMN05421858_5122 [Haladaptatus litoreus]|uniref:Uncharacterized protein n=1 Tax=Haladaptatus litoreus TaxID=553468 RepID=A0A1N7FJN2_9EURY|nr:hypothetical protein [Haladaptatus litoreus]SIS00569.1 hypothetical protein SAMN05421858_5122 [Haladaptatus litoreus]